MQLNWLDNPTPKRLSSGFPEKMVLLDCETTGGKATYHRIIEIGLLIIDNGELIETWQTFVDPEMALPPFIQRLTGIRPEMLDGAPLFADIASELVNRLEGRTLVAHNARFDYGFLKNEFQRAGIRYNAKPLCSVKFSRNLYPQFKRHGLSQIIQRFQLAINNRHRALDDAEMIYQFFLKSSALFADEEIKATCASILKRPSLPIKLDAAEVEKLPASAGVYYFYDDSGALLYIGKSVHIRNRVMSHFSGDHKNPKDLQMSSKIAHIDFHQTPTDFGAQIYESNQIKALLPLYNRRLRKVKKMFQYRTDTDELGYLRLSIEAIDTDNPAADEQFGLFRSPRQASKKMHQLADQYFLCHKLLGLESSHGRNTPCFRAQLKKCFGACCGKETAVTYNERMQVALKDYQIKIWPYDDAILIEERDPQNSELHCYHLVNNWRYVAKLSIADDIYDYGFTFHSNTTRQQEQAQVAPNAGEMDSRFDLDIYFILVRFLANTDRSTMSHLHIHPLTKANETQQQD
jgi:DNA polymerase-3 subunit epsilon